MIKVIKSLVCSVVFVVSSLSLAHAAPADSVRLKVVYDSYISALKQLTKLRDTQTLVTAAPMPDAYSFQLMASPTLYDAPLKHALSVGDNQENDIQLLRQNYINNTLASLYVSSPWLVSYTQQDMHENGPLRSDVEQPVVATPKLAEKLGATELKPEMDDVVEVVTRRPNFWKFTGRATAQFQQSYFSSNWFQGGEGNYAGNFSLKLTANYNDQKKITWENILDAQLGFQTAPSDENRTFRPTNNNLRFTTNFGYKAYKKLYYSLQFVANTAMVRNYQQNSDVLTAAFGSPLDITIAPGLKYTIEWGKKRKFTGTVNVAPLAYNLRYVGRNELIARYGVCGADNHGEHAADGSDCSHCKHQFGPNIDIRTHYEIVKGLTWDSRIFWFSNYHMTKIEWENTFNYRFNKYLTSQLYLYPRFEDSSPQYKSASGSYIMFKEWLSFGVAYDF